jgi:hypothetical protein
MHRSFAAGFAVLIVVLSASLGVVAQEPSASPSPSASPLVDGSPEVIGQSALPTFKEPAWKKITPAKGPAAREDHTWTVDADSRYAYLFGGRDGGKSFDDLWRYDLETDTWEKLLPGGKGPSARFGHSAVWADGFGVVVFAGQRGADFFGDLWGYDPASDKWTLLPANGEVPKKRYGTCMIVGPDGRLWISHGFTFAGRFDDTRAYNLTRKRWASIAPDGRRPGERCLHDCFRSASGELVLYGGQDNSVRALGDLWVTRPNGKWKREDDPQAKPRRLYAVTEAGDHAWIFGGAGKDDQLLGDLWRVDRETLKFKRIEVPGPNPAARAAGTLITDVVGGRLLLFGGKAQSAKGDVWQLTETAAAEVAPVVSEASAAPSEQPAEFLED